MTLLTRVPHALLAAAGLVAAVPIAALAQSGSALYAVGETDSRARTAPRPAAKPSPKPVPLPQAAPRSLAQTPVAAEPVPGGPTAAKPAAPPPQKASRKGTGKRNAGKQPIRSPLAIDGRWHDGQCIPLTGVTHSPPLFVKRQYEFDDARKTWLLQAAVYTSDSCTANVRMLTYQGEGSFAVTGKSRVASNAFDASFKIDRWRATPHSREGVLTLLNGRCGSGDFEQGRPLDLSATGCPILGIRSIAQSPREVELVSVSNGKFFMGTRSFAPGLSDDRPAQLSSYGLVRTP
jgi:hypothetical protein